MENMNPKKILSKEEILEEIKRLKHIKEVAPQQDLIDVDKRIEELEWELNKLENLKA